MDGSGLELRQDLESITADDAVFGRFELPFRLEINDRAAQAFSLSRRDGERSISRRPGSFVVVRHFKLFAELYLRAGFWHPSPTRKSSTPGEL